MRTTFAPRGTVAIALLFVVGTGCGSSFGGCGTLKPLPGTPGPYGVPVSQVIEGGVQARITAPGMKKLSAVIENLIATQLNAQLGCFLANNVIYDVLTEHLEICPNVQAACGKKACGAQVAFNSAQRPAPYNFDDGRDKADFSMVDGSNPVMNVDLAFDLHAAIDIAFSDIVLGSSTCSIEVYSQHWKGDATTKNFHVTVPLQFGIANATGELTLAALPVQITSLGLTLGTNGCPGAITTITSAFSDILGFFDTSIGNILLNFAANILQGPVNSIVQGFLPQPLGLEGVVDTASMLAANDAPPEAGLETFLVAGGYVSAKDRGLTLGVIAGMNSDRDPSTRTPTNVSEPSLCVPARAVPDLGGAPWNLPKQATRNDFTLMPAPPFAGMPDPVDAMGQIRDLTLGVSRTYFDLIGFHLYNSGTLCLHVDGSTVSTLTTGAISLLVPSLATITTEPKAPIQLVLRPQQPVVFTLGAGTSADALIHVALTDLRIDMYTWIEERWVRFLTLGLDLNIGLNLTVTKDAMMNPVLQPMLTGIDAASVTVRATNTDLLAEPPAQLESALPSLLTIAAGSLTGALPTISLPTVMGFSLDDLSVGRVQTSMDDFLGLFATIKPPATTAPLLDWTDPQHPRLYGEVRTLATIAEIDTPPPAQLQALFDAHSQATPARPTVKLALGADGANGRALEYAWKIDTSAWHLWTQDAHPSIDDDAFLLQGHHQITVRARAVGDYRSEDSQPVVLDALIDSVPPVLKPHLDDQDPSRLDFGGWDLVTPDDKLEYAYVDAAGQLTPFTKQGWLSLAEVGAITHNGASRLSVRVRDEAGLIGADQIDVVPYGHGSWGVPKASGSGCGCELGGQPHRASGGWIVLLGAAAYLMTRLRRRRRVVLRHRLGPTLWMFALAGASTLLVGCGCDHNAAECKVDDDCAKMQCDVGKIPQCQQGMCACNPDVPLGTVGDYSSMVVIDSTAYVAAYNQTYQDLMIGSLEPPGRVANWTFVDGVPDTAPSLVGGHVRGGVTEAGDKVGQFTSIAKTPQGNPVIAYYDETHGALKFASFGAIRWHAHIVDQGSSGPEVAGDQIGRWTSMSIDSMGRPGISYSALVYSGTSSGGGEGQLRFAQANTPDPQSAADWTITIVDSRPLPTKDPKDKSVDLLPNSISVMTATARRADDSPAIAYYDRARGNLRYAELSGGHWTTAILDGEANGMDTADVGQFPSLIFDSTDVGYISYVDASHDNLLFVDTASRVPAVVDDGYRPMDEMTSDGLPSPVFHLVGDSSSVQVAQGQVVIAYQDSTAVELRLATRDLAGHWTTQKVAGHDDTPFTGAYGFWASAQVGGRGVYLGSYGIDQQSTPEAYFFEVFFVDLGLQM
jgi:hypothetical protein